VIVAGTEQYLGNLIFFRYLWLAYTILPWQSAYVYSKAIHHKHKEHQHIACTMPMYNANVQCQCTMPMYNATCICIIPKDKLIVCKQAKASSDFSISCLCINQLNHKGENHKMRLYVFKIFFLPIPNHYQPNQPLLNVYLNGDKVVHWISTKLLVSKLFPLWLSIQAAFWSVIN